MKYRKIVPGNPPKPNAEPKPEKKGVLDVTGLHAGILLVHNHGWVASMPASGCYVEGDDLLSAPAEVRKLPPGLWVTNTKAKDLDNKEASGRRSSWRFRDTGFYRPALEDLCAEWAVPVDRKPPPEAVERLAWALQRVMVVVDEAGQRLLDGPPETWQPAGDEWFHERITEKPSLSTAILGLMCTGLPDDPEEQRLGDVMGQAYARGMAARSPAGGERIFRARVPGLRHAAKVLEASVPLDGDWVESLREETDTDELVAAEIAQAVEAGETPVIVFGAPRENGPALIESSGLGRLMIEKGRPRNYLVGEDFGFVKEQFRADGMIMGPGWRPSPFLPLLECLRETSSSCEEELKLISGYWCVNLAAENMLCAATRRTKMLRQDTGPSLAACWYAARDRTEMMPYWEALQDAGAEPLFGYAGRFRFAAPAEKQAVARIADVAWEAGLILDAATMSAFEELGAKMPHRTQNDWKGEIGEGILASILSRGNIAAMADIDSIRGWGADVRWEAWRNILLKNKGVPNPVRRKQEDAGQAA